MDLRLLGPVEASVDDHPVAIGAGKPRALLAMLALSEGSAVSSESADRRPLGRGAAGDRAEDGADLRLAAPQGVQRSAATARRSSPAATATSCGSAPARSTPAASSGSSPTARRARRSRCGADRRSTTSPPSRSRASRSAAWRSCGSPRSSRRSSRISPPGRHAEVIPEIQALLAQRAAARAPPRPADARALPQRPPGRRARRLPPGARRARRTRSASSPAPSCAASTRRSCGRTRRSTCRCPPSCRRSSTRGTPLVGRDAELGALREHWRRAKAGDGAELLVAGAPGIGKTRLAAELAAEVQRRRRPRALRVGCRLARGRAARNRAGPCDSAARRCSSSTMLDHAPRR